MKHEFIRGRATCTRRRHWGGKNTCGNNRDGKNGLGREQGGILSCLLLWVTGLALITFFCLVNHWPSVQARLQSEVETAVQTVGVAHPNVTLAGRDVHLQGIVPSTDIMEKATVAAGLVPGIRKVVNGQTIAQDVAPDDSKNIPRVKPSFSFQMKGDDITLAGRVPTEDIKQLLEAGIHQSFPASATNNNIEVNEATDNPVWLENTLQSLSSLKMTSEPQIDISGNTITIGGTVDSLEIANSVTSSVEPLFDESISFVNKLKVVAQAALIDPELLIQKQDNLILLSGVIRSDEEKLKLLNVIRSSFEESTVTNRLIIDPQAANALWMDSVLSLIPELNELETLDVMITAQGATVSGESDSELARAQQEKLISDTLGTLVPVVSNLSVAPPTSDSETQVAQETQIEPEINADSESKSAPEAETGQQTNTQTSTQTNAMADSRAETQTNPEPEVQVVRESQVEPEINADSEFKPEPEAGTEQQTNTQTSTQTSTMADSKAETETTQETESQAELIPTNEISVVVSPMSKALKALDTGKIRFQTASAVLTAESKLILDQMASILLQYPSRGVNIMGHTDSRGNEQRNLKLSEDRAEAVKQYLISKDISVTRLQAYGFGAASPIADNETAEGRALNRRIEFNY